MSDQVHAARVIPDRLGGSGWWKRWETILIVVAAAIFVVNAFASPYFLDAHSLSLATFNFTEKAAIAFAMALLIIAGEIDLSVALDHRHCLDGDGRRGHCRGRAGAAGRHRPRRWRHRRRLQRFHCHAFPDSVHRRHHRHDEPVPRHRLRGARRSGLPEVSAGIRLVRAGVTSSVVFSFEFVLFLVLAVIFGIVLHLTVFGRRIYAIGNNPVAAQFSGVRVDRIRFLLFVLTGLMSGVASVLLTSRIGSTRPTIATGYELEVVTMVVLGGVNILGGSGTIPGVVVARLRHGVAHVWLRPAQRAWHRAVDLHRLAAHWRDRAADRRGKIARRWRRA